MNNIHPTALLGPNVVLGDNCYIGPYCLIGMPAEWKGHENEDKGVYIGDNVRITGLVTIDSGVNNPTYIGDDCYLMKHSHVGHDAHIWNDVTISCGAKIGGYTEIEQSCNIGLNASIHQKLIIPEGCMIGMGAVVTKRTEMQPYSKYVGNPAKFLSENICK